MFEQVKHQYLPYANQELKWLPMDTEERYLNNLKTNYNQLWKLGWIDAPITYKFNSYGFRSDEFSHDPSIIFLGCSHTVGIGMPLEQTWPSIVSKTLGLKNFNLGVGGVSNDTAFRLAQHWIPQIKPQLVIFFSIEHSRFELHSNNTIQDYSIGNINLNNDIIWKTWIASNTNSEMNYLKNKLAIEQICASLNIKFAHIDYANILRNKNSLARDLTHCGTTNNQVIAEQFLKALS